MRRGPLLSVLCLSLLAGCLEGRQLSAGFQPWVVADGTPERLDPGWGVEVRVADSLDMELPVGWGARVAWSHHEAKPGRVRAEYFRTALELIFMTAWRCGSGGVVTFRLPVGPAVHYVWTDGPGDVGGFGLSVSPQFVINMGKRAFFSFGGHLTGWVGVDGSPVGTLAPFAAFGVRF